MLSWSRQGALGLCLLLAACAGRQGVAPLWLFQDAHSSGSRVAFSLDGKRLASAGLAGDLNLWAMPGGRLLRHWTGHRGSVNGLLFLPHEKLVSGGWDGRLILWSGAGDRLAERAVGSPVTALAPDADHRGFWSGHRDGRLLHWSAALRRTSQRRLPSGSSVAALAVAHGVVAAADRGGNLWLWPEGKDGFRRLDALPAYLRSLLFDPSGRFLYGGSWFRLYRWDLRTGKREILPTDHHGILKALAWDQGRQRLLSISRQTDSSVLLLDPATGATRLRLGEHDLCGADVAMSPRGRLAASTSDDGSVRVWKLSAESGVTASSPGKEAASP